MGIGRLLWRGSILGRTVDTVKNIKNEGSVTKGVKRTVHEDLCEDNPITRQVYKAGKTEGKKEGYEVASNEYEAKLLEQADLFLKQKQIFENERDEYEKLLDEYEKEIDTLSAKLHRTEEENVYLQELLMRDRKLRKLAQ